MSNQQRDYVSIAANLTLRNSRQDQLPVVVEALWEHLSDRGVSWLGFYLDQPNEPDDRRLVLGPHRDKPACSPIGLNGACGKALIDGETLIVKDVRDLGENYIACDPRDRSEIVIPLIDDNGKAWAVLDLDSWEPASFSQSDADGLKSVLQAAGLNPR